MSFALINRVRNKHKIKNKGNRPIGHGHDIKKRPTLYILTRRNGVKENSDSDLIRRTVLVMNERMRKTAKNK